MRNEPAVTLIVGGVDSGKTRFCRVVASSCSESFPDGCPRLDLDMGQNEIIPPATVAWSQCSANGFQPATLSQTRFVGAINPIGRAPALVAASRSLLDSCERSSPMVLVDTCGYIHGIPAARLFESLVMALQPRQVIVLQRRDECEHLLASLRYNSSIRLHRLAPSIEASRKSPEMRWTRRAMRYAAYFDGATVQTYSLLECACTSTWLGDGDAIPPHHLKSAADTLKCRVNYGERRSGFLGLLISGEIRNDEGASDLQRHFGVAEIAISRVEQMKHLLVGLHDGDGNYLGLGSIKSME